MTLYEGKPAQLYEVLNNDEFKGSLKNAYHDGAKSLDKDRSEDRMYMRARKPFFKKIDRTLSLNFNGRVKQASRKNI
jgi:hypothetical protein